MTSASNSQPANKHVKITPQLAQTFLDQLKNDLQQTLQLLQFLEAEKTAIEQRDYDAYMKMLHTKRNLLAQIERLNHERQKQLAGMGFSPDKQGFEDFTRKVPPSWREKFQTIWAQLTEQLERCRDLNQINGKILLHAQIATERLLQVVKGINPNDTIYRANGRTASSHINQHCLASA